MPTAKNASLEVEAGQNLFNNELLTDSGDNTKFNAANSPFSGVTGFEAVIRPNGVRSGGEGTPTPSTNDSVTVAALEVNLNGVVTSVAGAAVAFTRDAAAYHKVSITVNSGGSLAAIVGTGHASAHSDTRGANGGPPFIPVDSVEVFQVHLTSASAGQVTADEIKQVINLHREEAGFPVFDIDRFKGQVIYSEALPLIHTGSLPKRTYVTYYVPILAKVARAASVVPPSETFSTSSTATFDGAVNATTEALSQGTFTALIEDGVNDVIVKQNGKNVWFKFKPDKNKANAIWFQGFLSAPSTFEPDANNIVNCTVSAEVASSRVSG